MFRAKFIQSFFWFYMQFQAGVLSFQEVFKEGTLFIVNSAIFQNLSLPFEND